MYNTPTGTLWLVPAPLDFGTSTPAAITATIPQDAIQQATRISHWIVENAKTARAVLKRFGELFPLTVPLQQMHITELPHHVHKQGDADFDARPFLQAAIQGNDIGLMSEAGLPAIADPGASVVRAAHMLEIHIQPLVGPSSLILALMGSGMNGQNFAFTGYLPVQNNERIERIKTLEKLTHHTGQTQIFIETPYRNESMLRTLLSTLAPHTRLCIALGMTLPEALHISMPVNQWRQKFKNNWVDIQLSPEALKLPAVFLISK